MAERLPDKGESLEALKAGEQLKGPERQASGETREQAEHKQAEQLEAARGKLETTPEPQAKASEREAAPHATKLDKESAYWDTLRSVQRHLKPVSRSFSKVIHSPAVERASEVAGATVARPSVTLGATATALLVGGFLYITARSYGYSLSGSEFLLSLLVGGVLGILAEGIGKLFKRS
jgi:hypothetical protein